jgi:hypothetical protein
MICTRAATPGFGHGLGQWRTFDTFGLGADAALMKLPAKRGTRGHRQGG